MPAVPDDAALLRVEVAGICGTDVKMYGKPPFADPVIMGHENVGVVERAGSAWLERQGLAEGDRVFVEHYVGCFRCALVPRGGVPPLRGHRLAHQPRRPPLRLHLR